MNDNRQETLHRVEHNDDSLTTIAIGSAEEGFDFNRLGKAIATNTHLTSCNVYLRDIALNVTDRGFYDGLKQNTSIYKLIIECGTAYIHDFRVGYEILKAYQENNNRLKVINILRATNLHNEGAIEIATTLQCCTNIRYINLFQCNITANQLLPMIEAMRGCSSLEQLFLNDNLIGNGGCEALATLLKDPNCNIQTIQLLDNHIRNEGAIFIANSLAKNTKLKELNLSHNPINFYQHMEGGSVEDSFCKSLCNTSSINDTYLSNHTFVSLRLNHRELANIFLQLNKGTNKTHVAIKKIIKHHPDIDMEPLFGWDKDGEWTLKALPYVVAWFERAWVVKASDFDERQSAFVHELERDRFSRRTLSSIYQFAKAMPLLFVPADHAKIYDKKRKRSDE